MMAKTSTKKSVLLVDDEVDICDFLSEYIAQKDYNPLCANEIQQALAIAKKQSPAIIFLDNNLLDNIRGVDYIPQFKAFNESCKVYMLTANSKPEVRQRAEENGADGFIEKPFDFATLDKVLESLA